MPTKLTVRAVEGSTYIVTAAFTDEDGNAVTPNTLTWTLTDRYGNVINERDGETITPGTSVDIVLTGADLQVDDDEKATVLTVTIEGAYNSTYGNDLSIKDSCTFPVDGLTAA